MPIDADTFEQGQKRYSIENEIIDFLHDNRENAYNVHELTGEIMENGWSEANLHSANFEDDVGHILDLATVNAILDQLVDNGQVRRRILDVGQGERSYYRTP